MEKTLKILTRTLISKINSKDSGDSPILIQGSFLGEVATISTVKDSTTVYFKCRLSDEADSGYFDTSSIVFHSSVGIDQFIDLGKLIILTGTFSKMKYSRKVFVHSTDLEVLTQLTETTWKKQLLTISTDGNLTVFTQPTEEEIELVLTYPRIPNSTTSDSYIECIYASLPILEAVKHVSKLTELTPETVKEIATTVFLTEARKR